MRKTCVIIFIFAVAMFIGCTNNPPSNDGLSINLIQSSIGPTGEESNDVENQYFKYTLQLTNNEENDLKVISIEPILTEDFSKLVLSEELGIYVDDIISKDTSLEISGEIIFCAKDISKEEIMSMQPFVKEIKIIEEQKIKESF